MKKMNNLDHHFDAPNHKKALRVHTLTIICIKFNDFGMNISFFTRILKSIKS